MSHIRYNSPSWCEEPKNGATYQIWFCNMPSNLIIVVLLIASRCQYGSFDFCSFDFFYVVVKNCVWHGAGEVIRKRKRKRNQIV